MTFLNAFSLASAASRRRAMQAMGAIAMAGSAPSAAWAQFQVLIQGVASKQIPFSIAPFAGSAGAPVSLPDVVQADLERSGLFKAIAFSPNAPLDENARPDMAPLRELGSDVLLVGSMTKLADGRYDIRFRLWDVVQARDFGGLSFLAAPADLRLTAHRIADHIYERMTGDKGVFSTRIAYVSKTANQFNLWVADADGENARAALSSPEPIISPAWSPDGGQLAYVSFESRKPVIYAHDVASGKRRMLAGFKGSNSAPAWSPDGKSLAATLTLSGQSQIYRLDVNGGQPQRLSSGSSIDTEPAYSPDGQTLFFVSDRGGSPQIYRMPANGGPAQRVTFMGSYNISPAISPDGRFMVYVARAGSVYKVQLMDLSSNQVREITDTTADESPSFAANGRLVMYATRLQGKEVLMTSTVDGRIKTRLTSVPGDIREPDWGPFIR